MTWLTGMNNKPNDFFQVGCIVCQQCCHSQYTAQCQLTQMRKWTAVCLNCSLVLQHEWSRLSQTVRMLLLLFSPRQLWKKLSMEVLELIFISVLVIIANLGNTLLARRPRNGIKRSINSYSTNKIGIASDSGWVYMHRDYWTDKQHNWDRIIWVRWYFN